MAKFKDLNFKLAVINELMYVTKVLTPKFDRKQFAAANGIVADDLEYVDMIEVPAVRKYFEDLEIPQSALEKIKELEQDGGDEILMQLAPITWGGEDDRYTIRSADDAALLPNLKKVVLLYLDDGDYLLEAFEKKGIDANWV